MRRYRSHGYSGSLSALRPDSPSRALPRLFVPTLVGPLLNCGANGYLCFMLVIFGLPLSLHSFRKDPFILQRSVEPGMGSHVRRWELRALSWPLKTHSLVKSSLQRCAPSSREGHMPFISQFISHTPWCNAGWVEAVAWMIDLMPGLCWAQSTGSLLKSIARSKNGSVFVQIHFPVCDYYGLLWVASRYAILAKSSAFSIPETYSRAARFCVQE